jgi:hypothetical protein
LPNLGHFFLKSFVDVFGPFIFSQNGENLSQKKELGLWLGIFQHM